MGTSYGRPPRGAAGPLRNPLLSPLLVLIAGAAFPALPAAARQDADLQIRVDGQTLTLSSGVETVRDALVRARVRLGPNDEVTPALDSSLSPGAVIRVSRVEFEERTLDVKVPYKTVVRPAGPGLRPYHPTVVKAGHTGLKRLVYQAKLVDGQEAERTTLSETILKEPEPQVVVARQPAQLGSRGAYAGRKSMTVVATAYDPGPGSCGKYADGRTCNGKRAGYGIIAVDPKVIPLGAKLFVPGYGYGIAADVGSAIKGNHVDLGFNSRPGARQWGKKTVVLVILD